MDKPLHVAILAGETSGDILGSGLMRAIRQRHSAVRFTGIGGDIMTREGLDSRVPMERLSVMGLVEPLKRLPELLRIRREFFHAMEKDKPDVFIGIDSPDFNLDLEKKVRGLGIPTVHYVSPSVWAWRQGRIRKIRQSVDLMLTLFPFEEHFYQDQGVPVFCVGHPLADELPLDTDTDAARAALNLPVDGKVLVLMPGSREGEVARIGPVFLETARLCKQQWPELQLVIPCAGEARKDQIQRLLDNDFNDLHVMTVTDNSRQVMATADCLLMASGTAALEGMLLKKPMVVAYKMAAMSYAIISRMLKAPYVSLPNLLAGKALVPELLQDAATSKALFQEIQKILTNTPDLVAMTETWKALHLQLRRNASETAARAVLDLCRK